MSFEDSLAVECVRGLQVIKDRPSARRHVEDYLRSEGWMASADVIDLTAGPPALNEREVRTSH